MKFKNILIKEMKQYGLLFILLFLVLLTYLQTMMPSQAFHDAGEFQTFVYTLDIAHPTGYPTYIILGKALISMIPVGEVVWKVNYLSVIYSIATLFFLGVLLIKLTKNILISSFVILLLAFNKDFWTFAGIADPHTLDRTFLFLLLTIFLYLSKHWKRNLIFIFGLIFGLGLGNHLFLIYSVPGFFIWYVLLIVKKRIKFNFSDLVIGGGGFLLGLLVYLFLPIRVSNHSWILTPDYSLNTWAGFYRHVFGADFQGLMFQGGYIKILENMSEGVLRLIKEITPPLFLVGILGLVLLIRKHLEVGISLLIMFIFFLAFSTNYVVTAPERYYLSYIGIYLVFIGIGFASINEVILGVFKRFKLVYPQIGYLVTVLLVITYSVYFYTNNFDKANKSKEFEARIYSRNIFKNVSSNAVILSWWNYSTPLWYRQYVLGERKDVLIINKSPDEWDNYVMEYVNKRPVYAVESHYIEDKYDVMSVGGIYQITNVK